MNTLCFFFKTGRNHPDMQRSAAGQRIIAALRQGYFKFQAVRFFALPVAALGGKALLPWLHKLKFGQPIKVNFGPSWHANKQGTPTMGGILFIVASSRRAGG